MTAVLLGAIRPAPPVVTPPPPPASQSVPASFYGINVQNVWKYPTAWRVTHLNALKAQGIEHVRYAWDWHDIEPTTPKTTGGATSTTGTVHDYHWGSVGSVGSRPWMNAVAESATAGLRMLPCFTHSPVWANKRSNYDHGVCADALVFQFVNMVVTAYKMFGPKVTGDPTRGTFWIANPSLPYHPWTTVEIWNEQDGLGNWGTDMTSAQYKAGMNPDVAGKEYAFLFSSVATALKALTSPPKVIMGGLAGGPSTPSFDRTVWNYNVWHQAAVNGYSLAGCDGVTVHPYGQAPTGTGTSHPKGSIHVFRRTPAATGSGNGASAPGLDFISGAGTEMDLYVTEVGNVAGTPDITNIDANHTGLLAPSPQEATREKYITEIAQDFPRSDMNIVEVCIHNSADSEVRDTIVVNNVKFTDGELFFGLFKNSDGTANGSGLAYGTAIQKMTGPNPLVGTVTF